MSYRKKLVSVLYVLSSIKKHFSKEKDVLVKHLTAVSSLVPLGAQKNTPRVDLRGNGNPQPSMDIVKEEVIIGLLAHDDLIRTDFFVQSDGTVVLEVQQSASGGTTKRYVPILLLRILSFIVFLGFVEVNYTRSMRCTTQKTPLRVEQTVLECSITLDR